ALASASQGEDAAQLDARERLALRRQALTWLRGDLRARQKQSKSWWPGEADRARAALADWRKDPDLAGLRDTEALKALSAEERQACTKLWADVAAISPEEARGYAARGNWKAAAAGYKRFFAAQPLEDGELGFEYAAVLLLSGDQAGYRKMCA